MFKPAQRPAAPVRMLLTGPPGSGKTLTALRIASGMGSRIAVLDSYGAHADWYAGYDGDGAPLAFDGATLPRDTGAAQLVAMIRQAGEMGYEVLVIDSLSPIHAQIRGRVDSAPKPADGWARYREDMQRLLDAIHAAPLHILLTAEAATTMSAATARDGRSISTPTGGAIQGIDTLGYGLDYWLSMSEGVARIVKAAPHPALPGSDHPQISAEWARQHLAPRHALQARQPLATPQVDADPTQDTPTPPDERGAPPAASGGLPEQSILPSAVQEVKQAAGAAVKGGRPLAEVRAVLSLSCVLDGGRVTSVPRDPATRAELIRVLAGG